MKKANIVFFVALLVSIQLFCILDSRCKSSQSRFDRLKRLGMTDREMEFMDRRLFNEFQAKAGFMKK